jgi:hypothetical protein
MPTSARTYAAVLQGLFPLSVKQKDMEIRGAPPCPTLQLHCNATPHAYLLPES